MGGTLASHPQVPVEAAGVEHLGRDILAAADKEEVLRIPVAVGGRAALEVEGPDLEVEGLEQEASASRK